NLWQSLHDGAEAADPGGNQKRIRQEAKGRNRKHVTARQALAKHEGILRTDGDDEAATEEEARVGRPQEFRHLENPDWERRVAQALGETRCSVTLKIGRGECEHLLAQNSFS